MLAGRKKVVLLLVVAALVGATPLHAQPTAKTNSALKVESTDPLPPRSAFVRIDEGFQVLVDWLGSFLLFRVGAPYEQYVALDHQEFYVREPGSEGSFVRLDPSGASSEETITTAKAETLLVTGKLTPGYDPVGKKERPFRLGKVGDRKVEFLTVNVDTKSRYFRVSAEGKFHKLGPKRGLLSKEADEILTREEVDDLARAGRLRLDPARAGEPDAHILSELSKTKGFPLVVLWLVIGALFFTFYLRGFNIRGFGHAIEVVRGKYDNPHEAGEVTHFQALASALSGTLGLGNIAGVTFAMTAGGPGAFFWMMVCGILGMSSKFVECTLGAKYRKIKPDGVVQGGPFEYLRQGLAPFGKTMGHLGTVLAGVFAVMCALGSLGGGNMFQANQAADALLAVMEQSESDQLLGLNRELGEALAANDLARAGALETERRVVRRNMDAYAAWFRPVFGAAMALMVAVVILGGIRRIAAASEKIVPLMCGTYMLACAWIIFKEYHQLPKLITSVFSEAFSGAAVGGGLIGAAAIGMQRAAFSNEAGIGSASIAHSAARTNEPVREGVVALLEPFLDTVVVCSMTAMVILMTGAWDNDAWVVDLGLNGSRLTSRAFAQEISWFPIVLALASVLFAYATIISWTYYGERSWEHLFGARSVVIFRVIAVTATFIGSIVNLGAMLDFSDMMILAMAFPNILGLFILAPLVKRDLDDYWRRYKAGEFEKTK